jgi:6,7-dimethyl-8-ribityllumazine synthase
MHSAWRTLCQAVSSKSPAFVPTDIPLDTHVAVVAARFNANIVDVLLDGCVRRLREIGIGMERIEVHRVPGAFELPVAAKVLAETKRFRAIICLGCIVRGDTPHFDYVAGGAARGVQQVALSEGLPVIFGVLTTNTEQQALDRAGGAHGHAGVNAAEAAAEMIVMIDRARRR